MQGLVTISGVTTSSVTVTRQVTLESQNIRCVGAQKYSYNSYNNFSHFRKNYIVVMAAVVTPLYLSAHLSFIL